MKKRIRIVAIIVKNHNLLLVKGSDKYKEYWTPGGKREEGESDIKALQRELNEEINVRIISTEFFKEYTAKSPYEDELVISRVYIVNISGKIQVGKEIQKFVWMTKNEFNDEIYPLIAITRQKIIPEIIKAGYF